jgi:hypothetical protein
MNISLGCGAVRFIERLMGQITPRAPGRSAGAWLKSRRLTLKRHRKWQSVGNDYEPHANSFRLGPEYLSSSPLKFFRGAGGKILNPHPKKSVTMTPPPFFTSARILTTDPGRADDPANGTGRMKLL